MKVAHLIFPAFLLSCLFAVSGYSEMIIAPGDEQTESALTYGWSYSEPLPDGQSMRWIEKFEGEIELPQLSPDVDRRLLIEARPVCRDKKIQSMGLYLNGKYITEWLMNTNGQFEVYEAELSARDMNSDHNRLIIRAGFVYSPENEPRELSIAVKKIIITEKQ